MIPVEVGVAVGGALTATAPVFAAHGATAALLKQVETGIVLADESDQDSCKGMRTAPYRV